LETSTPIKKTPTTAKDLIDRNKFPMKECVKTSKSQSSGTGTHIRSTLDCDITLSTTKEVNVTEIPIEIKGELNGLPWCTTIRLRVKHDANEKPTFIPNRCKIITQSQRIVAK
uniref:E3 SUMO-protein ligase KIAA1586-like n=1 Tax=Brugia timori TaxID=42155 RepID=A0A0R3R6C6_9BILA